MSDGEARIAAYIMHLPRALPAMAEDEERQGSKLRRRRKRHLALR
jgi:hypothetical protein